MRRWVIVAIMLLAVVAIGTGLALAQGAYGSKQEIKLSISQGQVQLAPSSYSAPETQYTRYLFTTHLRNSATWTKTITLVSQCDDGASWYVDKGQYTWTLGPSETVSFDTTMIVDTEKSGLVTCTVKPWVVRDLRETPTPTFTPTPTP